MNTQTMHTGPIDADEDENISTVLMQNVLDSHTTFSECVSSIDVSSAKHMNESDMAGPSGIDSKDSTIN